MRRYDKLALLVLILLSGCSAGMELQAGGPPAQSDADGGTTAPAAPDAGAPMPSCLASSLLAELGKSKLLVGADMTDSIAEMASFDVRYLYLAGGLADGSGICSSCSSGCTAGAVSCANSGPGCAWWGCWQSDASPPGHYVRDLLAKAQSMGELPMITYYELLQTSGVPEGDAEISTALRDTPLMTRFFNDWRFVLQQLGSRAALLHLEPDLWGYAQKLDANPHRLAAAVARANPTDCARQEESVAGLGRCLIAMVRKYAPNAKVGLHASAWGTGIDTHQNTDPSLDVAAEARRLGDFLIECGAKDSDYVVIEASDRDAGFYRTLGKETFWDPTDATLPTFRQAFTWARALTERIGRPALWWQLPLGNMALPNTINQWQDNRVDYFFSHPADVARSNAFGMVFGAGESRQTKPYTDQGNFVSQVQHLAAAAGQTPCP